ncbi:MAG: DM13 domain-containing protein [Litorivicinus sp.]
MKRIFAVILSLPLFAHAGLFDDIKTAVTGHIADFQSRSQPDQILEGATVVRSTAFRTDDPGQDVLHTGQGGVSLVQQDGMTYIQLHADVEIGLAPDLYLYVSDAGGINTEARFNETDQIEIAPLVKGKGASYYSLGELTDEQIAGLASVTVWCKQFGEFMASADW